MTRTELENSMNDIYLNDTGLSTYYGTGYYWRQVAAQNWHENVNNVQTRYANVTDFICKFFEVAIEKVTSVPDGAYVFNLADA